MVLRTLKTIDDVIGELGGKKAVAALTNRLSDSAVPMWKLRKSFPLNTYAVMKAALEAKGATAPDSLWGMAKAEEMSS